MNLSNRRRVMVITFSMYYSLFSGMAFAADKTNKKASKPSAQKASNVQGKGSRLNSDANKTPAQLEAEKKRRERKMKALQWAGPDNDLFPASIANPQGAVNSGGNNGDPFLNPQVFSNGPISNSAVPGSISGNTIPGTISGSFPPNDNNTMTAAAVPSEFACPIFDQNPYSAIIRGLNSMKQSINFTPDCQAQKNIYDDINSDSDRIRNAIVHLQGLKENPDQLQNLNKNELERFINDAVVGVTNISNKLSTNRIFSNQCGRQTTSFSKLILAFNDVVNNLAPLALIVASFNPAASATTKLALLGAVSASSTITAFSDYIRGQQLDMNNSDIRKAVVQNTCQFIKIREKMKYLQNNGAGNFSQVKFDPNLDEAIKKYKSQYQNPSQSLYPALKYRYNMEKALAEVEVSLEQDRADWSYYNTQVNHTDGMTERDVCDYGTKLVNDSRVRKDAFGMSGGLGMGTMDPDAPFPYSILANLDRVAEILQQNSSVGFPSSSFFQPTLPSTSTTQGAPSTNSTSNGNSDPFATDPTTPGSDPITPAVDPADDLFKQFISSAEDVAAWSEKVRHDRNNIEAVKTCAIHTKEWLTKMANLMRYTQLMTNDKRADVEKVLSGNKEYRAWSVEYERLKFQRRSVMRAISVLRLVTEQDSAVFKSEMAQSANELKIALFSKVQVSDSLMNRAKNLITRKSPVEAYLQNNIEMHTRARGDFKDQLKILNDAGQLYLKRMEEQLAGKSSVFTSYSSRPNMAEIVQRDDGADRTKKFTYLSILNDKFFNRTNSVDKTDAKYACDIMRTAINKFNDANTYLAATQLFCDMISEVISDSGPDVVNICRGTPGYEPDPNKPANISLNRSRMSQKDDGGYSLNDYAKILKTKVAKYCTSY